MPYDIIIGRNEDDKKRFGKKGLIYIGKSYVKMGRYTSLSNNVFMDVARSHVVLIAGKRGSGKSYSLGVIAEELSTLSGEEKQNISAVIFDTMGIYWTMKFQNEKDKELLSKWELEPQNIPIRIFVPFGHFDKYLEKGIPIDEKFAIDVSEIKAEDWINLFELELIDPVSILIQKTLSKLGKKFFIRDIIEEIEKDKESDKNTKNAAKSLFLAAETWGIFATPEQKPISIDEISSGGKTNVIDLSVYNSIGSFNIRALVISLVSRKLFNERMEYRKKEEIEAVSKGLDYFNNEITREKPLVWIFIDEAHEFLPNDGKTIATDALIQLLREGRQPGVSVVLATQQPGKIHTDVMTQSDIVISHRVTSAQDLKALNNIMQSYILEDIQTQMNNLPTLKGSAIILDDNSERIYSMRIRPRFTWHGGEAPTAVKEEKEF